jgi:hypothetical protein
LRKRRPRVNREHTLKGLCHEMNIFLKADSFYHFCFLFDEKIKLKVLACSFEITY